MTKRVLMLRILSAVFALLFVFTTGCMSSGDGETTAAVTSDITTEEEYVEETEAPEDIVMVKISDKLEMPKVTSIATVKSLSADLNTILIDGYGEKSQQEDAFNKVFNKLLIFTSKEGCNYAFVLGEKKQISSPALTEETGHYIALNDVADIMGGTLTFNNADYNPVTTLVFGDKTAYCAGDKAYLSKTGAASLVDGADEADVKLTDGKHYLNVKDISKLTGLNVYYTDSGYILFSAGQAFDKLKGYYIAEEAAKLFMETEEEKQAFSVNMFVDIPNIIKLSAKNVTAYTFPKLDLNANVTAYALQGVKANVTLAPAIVAGQGNDEDNYTVVRVFDIYQTVHTQFNAYPSTVRGGVQVAAAVAGKAFNILTAPYSDASVNELLVYDANGSYKFCITPSGSGPYAIAAGAFIGENDVFAVTPMSTGGTSFKIEFFSAVNGSPVGSAEIVTESNEPVLLSADKMADGGDGLIISFRTSAYEYKSGTLSEIKLDGGEYNGVFASAFGGYVSTSDADDEFKAFSEITEYKDGSTTVINAGARENIFYSTAAEKDTDYVKKGTFWHLRVDCMPPVRNAISEGDTRLFRSNDYSLFTTSVAATVRGNARKTGNMWEPCSTHRWGKADADRYLIDYIDPDTGMYAYAVLTKTNKRTDYVELGSEFYNATYAPYIPALDRLNYWTKRSYFTSLAPLFRKAPENTVAVSPVHEHEIDSGKGTVGDYNPKMIMGFADWLEQMYGTIENVNKIYGTKFKSFDVLDAPRNTNKGGGWNKYSDKDTTNEYFTAWVLYNRYIISQRIIESYREALLAGIPPEMITAHQIPEGDAVAGFLGEADTRITPVDVVLADGTGYGSTRYFNWYNRESENSFFALAVDSGHRNMTLGEYSAVTADKEAAYEQLKYMFDNGLLFAHVLQPWPSAEADASEKYAVEQLQELGQPRSASSGGTGEVRAYKNGDAAMNIVEIGTKEDTPGLLKSITADGSFTGEVYLQPFHAFVGVVDLARDATANGSGTLEYEVKGKVDAKNEEVTGLNYNDTVDVRITAKPVSDKGTLIIKVFHEGVEIPVDTYTFTVKGSSSEYRYLFKNQVYLKDCTVKIEYEGVEISDCDVTLMYEMTARKYFGELSPKAHKGGVSFDILF